MGWKSVEYVTGKLPSDKHWALSALCSSDMLFVKEFAWGKEIDEFPAEVQPDDQHSVVGIVLSGVCEVYDYETISTTPPIYCHRPIRLLEPGDIFNDFKYVDRAVLAKPLEHKARNGEKWGVLSGINSMIAILSDEQIATGRKVPISTSQYVDADARFDGTIQGFVRDVNPKFVSEIAYFKAKIQPESDIFFLSILKSAWKRVQTYRESPNSYNISSRAAFINRCNIFYATTHPKGSRKPSTAYSNRIHNETIFPIFVEAIYDALNRVHRHEPLFVEVTKNGFGVNFDNAQTNCLIAKRIRDRDQVFYFPIDLANHIICSHAKQHSNTEGDIISGFGQGSARGPRKNVQNLYHGKDEYNIEYKGSNKHFWKMTAEKILKVWKTTNKSFAYDLSVEVMCNENMQCLLFVKFVKKSNEALKNV
jgi:hypothetical protein